MGCSGTESTITEASNGVLYQPRMAMDDDECGAVGGILDGGKPAVVPLRPPQIPHDLTRDRTRAAAMGSRRLTA
jgi:hypothetical protein